MQLAPPLLRMPVGHAVWSVAWPMVLLGLLRSATFLVDTYWIGGLGPAALAAVGGCAFAWWILLILSDLAAMGVHTLIARAEGAGHRDGIPHLIAQAGWVAVGTSLLSASAWPLRTLYLDALGFDATTEEYALGSAFLGASLLGAGAAAAHHVVAGVFRSLGHTRAALVITALTLAVNAGLDPMLIHGWGLGIAGAAWATAAANAVGAVVGALLLAREGLPLELRAPDLSVLRRIVTIGLPVTAHGVGFSLVYVALGSLITQFGTHEMAALGVGHRLESLAYLFAVGLSVGASTLVGQSLGAGRPEHARAATHAALAQCSAAMLLFSALFWVGAPAMVGAFTDDPVTAAAGVRYLHVQAPVFLFMGVETVFDGAFTGAGHTRPPFWIGTVLTAARIPAAWALAWGLDLGVTGIWLAIALSTVSKGVALGLWFGRGTWAA